MSVIIKGMKPSKGCDSCELVQDYDEDSMCCPFLRSESWYGAAPDYRLEHCPQIEIPTPHGRLIDADRLYDLVENRYRVSCGIEHRCERDLLDLICEMPTIIEAEVSE